MRSGWLSTAMRRTGSCARRGADIVRGGVMRCRVAVEDIEPNHYVCWVLDLPGCFSSARDHEDAVALAPSRIAEYYAWVIGHDPSLPEVSGPFHVDVVEVFEAHPCATDPGYLVNAFFEDDRRPLSYWDVEVGLRLLDWSRQDLLNVLDPLSSEQLHKPIRGQVHGTIAGILEHVCRAENWYLSQFDLSIERASMPEDLLAALEAVRANTRTQLARLIGNRRITEACDERWSARKILRRTLWHERDHTQHVARLAARLGLDARSKAEHRPL
jgi:uncharacterized damage-inducible protein DinB